MNRWLILQRNYGQLGNRLHTHANATAWCLENKINLINLSFFDYSDNFTKWHGELIHSLTFNKTFFLFFLKITTKMNLLDRICRSDKWLKRTGISHRVCHKKDNQTIGEEGLESLFAAHPRKKLTLVRAWDLRCPRLVSKHQDEIRNIFTPKHEFTEDAQFEMVKLRKKYDCLVGVHARRGDYQQYLAGIHFHSWDLYQNWIIQAKDLLEECGSNNVGFLICSDEDTPASLFSDLPVHFMSKTSAMTDLHALSLCDYNIGPPSSFGTWISWYGNVPRVVIQKDTKVLSLNQFRVSETC